MELYFRGINFREFVIFKEFHGINPIKVTSNLKRAVTTLLDLLGDSFTDFQKIGKNDHISK